MSEPDKPLRQQMTDAMASIRAQLETLRAGPTMGEASDDRSVIAALEAEFEALANARDNVGGEGQ
jgi:hypothetical protein